MQYIAVTIVGNAPGMLQANLRAANPLDPASKQLKAAQDALRSNKTDDNLLLKLDAEWTAHLYWDDGRGIHVPRKQIQGSLLKAGKKHKAPGKRGSIAATLASTLSPKGNAYIELPGGEPHLTREDLEALRDDPDRRFRYDDIVSIGDNSVLKTRPLIPEGWRATLLFEYQSDDAEAPGLSVIRDVLDTMGRGGFGDWRPNSPTPGEFGTFTVESFKVSDDGKKWAEPNLS